MSFSEERFLVLFTGSGSSLAYCEMYLFYYILFYHPLHLANIVAFEDKFPCMVCVAA